MIHHIVMWKIKDNLDKEISLKKIKQALENLKIEIKEIQRLHVGINVESILNNFDIVLDSHFNTLEDLEIYQKHPKHMEVVSIIKSLVKERASVDYEY